MIKLKDIVNEISLSRGHASATDLHGFFNNAVEKKFIKKKKRYSNIYDNMSWRGLAVEDFYTEKELEQNYNKCLKEFEALIRVDSEFLSDLAPIVSSSGQYSLHRKSDGSDINFMLGDKSAKNLAEYFIGTIRIEKETNYYNFTPKKAFGLQAYQIHWSNVAKEKMGQGMGKLIYEMVYKHISSEGAALVSDTILFEGSQKMWMSYVPSIASWFGAVVRDVYIPISKEEMVSSARSIADISDSLVAMENPPALIRKVANNFKGLSFSAGQYGVMQVKYGINKKLFSKAAKDAMEYDNFVYDDKTEMWRKKKEKDFKGMDFTYPSNLIDEANSLKDLIWRLRQYGLNTSITSGTGVGDAANLASLKSLAIAFDDAIIIVKETGGRLTWVAI
jgi:hypothetical protein